LPQSAVIGEVGYLDDNLTHSPKTVVLSQRYANPVVLAQPLSYDGSDTSVVRITDVQSDCFTLYVHEAPNHNGTHTNESVSYRSAELASKPGVAGEWGADGAGLRRQQRDSEQALLCREPTPCPRSAAEGEWRPARAARCTTSWAITLRVEPT
jgi:hypothetical protein